MSLAAGKIAPLLTEAAIGFASRLLQQYDRLVAARKIHYITQKCYLRGKQSGTIRLENTAMLLSQKRPRKQTRRGLYPCQSQCILLFQQQFESDLGSDLNEACQGWLSAGFSPEDSVVS